MGIPRTIQIGYVGEKQYRAVDIDISELLKEHPDAVAVLYHKRGSDEEAYPCVTEMVDSNTLRWVFSAVDTAEKGYGEAQITMVADDGECIGKSKVIETVTGRSLTASDTVPEEFEPWVNQVSVIRAEIQTIYDSIGDRVHEIDEAADSGIAKVQQGASTAVDSVTNRGNIERALIDAKADEVNEQMEQTSSEFFSKAKKQYGYIVISEGRR